MVLGRISTARRVHEICFLCALRAETATLRASRRLHTSRKVLSQSSAAEKVETSESTDLYGSRYSSRTLPSWKKSIADKAPTPARTSTVTSSNTAHRQNPSKARQGRELVLSFRGTNNSARDSSHPSQGTAATRANPTSEGANNAEQNKSTRSVKETTRYINRRFDNGTKSVKFNDEFRNGLDNEESSADARTIERREQYSEPGVKLKDGASRRVNDTLTWSKLSPKSVAPPSESLVKDSSGGIARFEPQDRRLLQKSTPRAVEPTSQKPSTSSTKPESNRGPLRASSTDYVGFRNTEASSQGAGKKPAEEASPPSSRAASLFSTSRQDLPDRFKEGRRAAFWQEDDSKTKKSPRLKSSKSSSKQDMEDEDDGLDPERLERIEARQRRKAQQKVAREERASGQVFVVPSFISVGNLASSLKIRAEAFSAVLRNLGFSDLSNDHIIDAETAGLIAGELGFKAVLPAKTSEIDLVARPAPKETDILPSRPPVVTIMGHVDHGKTTLLDWLRNSSVAASEHGGITQHIGAFTVQMPSGRIITFLDTPGHAAFLEMRARGANVTDIVILVVAADDSVKPQTIEAIKHAKAAKTQIVVAISKIDKPEADPDRVKQDLARNGIEVEDYGGDTQTVGVSGKTGEGMDQLEDAIIALADILDVKAETTGDVEGWVLEAARKASGKIATVLVRRGTLKPGQIIVAGHTWARIRNLRDEAGVIIDEALPGTPVEVDGWDEQPEAGAEVLQATNEQKARRVVEYRIGKAQIEKQTADVAVLNESRKQHDEKRMREKARAAAVARGEEVEEEEHATKASGLTEIPIIIRADVSGSIEAVNASVLALGNSEVQPIVIRSAVGNVSESDVEHAAAARGHIVNFNLTIDGEISRLAEQSGVKIIDGNIIYRITDDVKAVLEEYLPPIITHHVTGEADILQVFDINLKGNKKLPVAGCKIRNGTITKGSKVKVIRGGKLLYDGILSSLKNVKKDVTEMRKGMECGMSFDDYQAFDIGDQVQCYETKTEKRRL